MEKSESRAATGAVRRRTVTYGGLGLALIFLAMQVAPPRMPAASAATGHDDALRLLPPLPTASALPSPPSPGDALFEITLLYPQDGDLAALLVHAGAGKDEARQATALLGDQIDPDSDIKLALGAGSAKPIERLTILNDLGRTMVVRDGGTLRLMRSDAGVRHVSVDLGKGAYWSLRGAGLDARLALEAAALIERRAGMESAERVTVVIGERPDRFGHKSTPELLYLAASRDGRPTLKLLRWTSAPGGWIDPNKALQDEGLMRPVAARMSSGFGVRFHPILHFFRPHEGVDFAAGWGAPVRAAADGRVTDAGWHGGYGRQVRLDHGHAMGTTYSHLSAMTIEPGSWVRRGQLIGYVGASGLATGPHLHFEVTRLGQPIDPLRARLIDSRTAADRSAVAARLAQLNIVGT